MLEVGDCVVMTKTAGVPPPRESSATMLEVGDGVAVVTNAGSLPSVEPPGVMLEVGDSACCSSTGLWLGLLVSFLDVLPVGIRSTGL
jgi:hypothetical protein